MASSPMMTTPPAGIQLVTNTSNNNHNNDFNLNLNSNSHFNSNLNLNSNSTCSGPASILNNCVKNGSNLKQRLKRVELLLDIAAQQLTNPGACKSPPTSIDTCDGSSLGQQQQQHLKNGQIFTTANSAISAIGSCRDVVDDMAAGTIDNTVNCLRSTTAQDIKALQSMLSCPIFCRIVNVETSLDDLKQQLQLHPSIVPPEFDLHQFTGELILTPPVPSSSLSSSSSATSATATTTQLNSLVEMPTSMMYESLLMQPPTQKQQTIDESHNSLAKAEPTTAASDDQELPEMEKFEVTLEKDGECLGITIAGYVCEKEGMAGIFIRSIHSGSPADLNGKIRINDQIYSVDGISLINFSNSEAVEFLKTTGSTVRLGLMRYLRGSKFQKLQKARRLKAPPGN